MQRGAGREGRLALGRAGGFVSYEPDRLVRVSFFFLFSFLGVGGWMGLKVREYFRVPRLGEPEGPGRRRQLPCRLPSNGYLLNFRHASYFTCKC